MLCVYYTTIIVEIEEQNKIRVFFASTFFLWLRTNATSTRISKESETIKPKLPTSPSDTKYSDEEMEGLLKQIKDEPSAARKRYPEGLSADVTEGLQIQIKTFDCFMWHKTYLFEMEYLFSISRAAFATS